MSNNTDKDIALTEQQEIFVTALFDENQAAGDTSIARDLAGYSPKVAPAVVLKSKAVQAAIRQRTEEYLSAMGPKAAIKLSQLLDKPTTPSGKIILDTARDILDRAGVVKKAETEITLTAPNAIIILPAKNQD